MPPALQLACTVPVARFSGATLLKVALNGEHFVGSSSSSSDGGGSGGGGVAPIVPFDTSATSLFASAAMPQPAGFDGGTVGLTFLYYAQPELYSVTPLSGPTVGSGAVGMSHQVFSVTLTGRGFDRLADVARDSARCRFGDAASPTVSLGPTHAVCLLPPGVQGESLVAFSINGQVRRDPLALMAC